MYNSILSCYINFSVSSMFLNWWLLDFCKLCVGCVRVCGVFVCVCVCRLRMEKGQLRV